MPSGCHWPAIGRDRCQPVVYAGVAAGVDGYNLTFRAGFTLYMVTIIEIYSVKPALNNSNEARSGAVRTGLGVAQGLLSPMEGLLNQQAPAVRERAPRDYSSSAPS